MNESLMANTEIKEVKRDSKQSDEAPSNEEIESYVTFVDKISWFFQPIFPVYEVVKVSSEYASRIFGILETIVSRLLSILGKDSSHNNEMGDYTSLDPVISSLFKIWFQAYANLRQSIYYIEALYEEIVPLIPDQDPPFFDMDVQGMTIRGMCCYATLHMFGRLPYHAKRFIGGVFKRIKSFILRPTERITWDY